MQFGADGDYFANYLDLKHWADVKGPCEFCNCNAPDISKGEPTDRQWSDFRSTVTWKQNLTTPSQWIARVHRHPLWASWALTGVVLFCICIDVMHAGDLGVLKYFLGSVIWTLVWESDLEGDFDMRVSAVWRFVLKAYDVGKVEHNYRIDWHTFKDVFSGQRGPKPSAYPELKGKAAQNRHLLPVLLQVCAALTHGQHLTEPKHVKRLEALQFINHFYELISGHGHFLPRGVATEVLATMEGFLLRQNWLNVHYTATLGVRQYNVTFKSHLLWHSAEQARWFNPRTGWCYREESFMGKVGKLVRSCVFGLGPLRAPMRVAQKWRRLMWYRLRKRLGYVMH
jgi:hypothetical protein